MAKSNIPELVPFGNFILKKYGVDAVVTAEDLAAFDATGEPEAAVVEESKPLSDHSQDEALPDDPIVYDAPDGSVPVSGAGQFEAMN